MGWWLERMPEDFVDGGFTLHQHSLPCCGVKRTLDQLRYDWPQGFARFAFEVMNANIGGLDEGQTSEFEHVLGTRLRKIFRHI